MPPWPFSPGAPSQANQSPRRTGPSPALDLDRPVPPIESSSDANFSNPTHSPAPIPNPASPRRSHGRSLSGNLPSLFGGVKKRNSRDELSRQNNWPGVGATSSSYDGNVESITSPKKWPQKGRQEDGEVETGSCSTCGSRIKWPKGLSEFRCTTCLMVNDLRPRHSRRRTVNHREGELTIPKNEQTSAQENGDIVSNLTVQRTQAIIDRCIKSFLSRALVRTTLPNGRVKMPTPTNQFQTSLRSNGGPGSPSPKPFASTKELERSSAVSPEQQAYFTSSNKEGYFQSVNLAASTTAFTRTDLPLSTSSSPAPGSPIRTPLSTRYDIPAMPLRKPPAPPTHVSSPVSTPGSSSLPLSGASSPIPNKTDVNPLSPSLPFDDGKGPPSLDYRNIFKPLEDHIVQAFSHECLNCSFLITNTGSDSASSIFSPSIRQPETSSKRSKILDAPLSEVDAKTLLLGDVAENGLWWTGRGELKGLATTSRKYDQGSDSLDTLVDLRSPRIDTAAVEQWYTLIIHAGNSWRQKLNSQEMSSLNLNSMGSVEAQRQLDETFAKARLQAQRTLLKASDNLLKRPGRPLKTPNDIRFLLILLANPLLYSGAQMQPKAELTQQSSVVRSPSAVDGDDGLPAGGVWNQRHSFTILKRILGLLSNRSSETHRHLTSWFSHYDEYQFRKLLDLIQNFVTYRIGRQHDRKQANGNVPSGLIPGLAGTSAETSAQLHAAMGLADKSKGGIDSSMTLPPYSNDWQIKSAARIFALLFSANKSFHGEHDLRHASPNSKFHTSLQHRGQLLTTSEFYNTMVDFLDLLADFDIWESTQSRFSFCQYPFLLSIGAKIRIMEYDARRQMEIKAREAFFNSILRNRAVEHYLTLRVRRECLVEDSLKGISEVVGASQQEIKKQLKVQFVDEEGLDAGGLRKEWFLLLVREIFEPQHGLFIYDEESQFCYFNPHSFETSDQYFLVGVLLGLAIYNSTILDVALPPFTFKKLLASASNTSHPKIPFNRTPVHYSLDDLAEYRPTLAKGLRKLLEYDGDVEAIMNLSFVIEVDRYGSKQEVPLCPDGATRPVTNSNRQEFVDLYVRYLLDTSVSRQFEPFKRGFFIVCGGNALSLFQPEEIELLVRGSDEPLDVPSLKAVAVYENWRNAISAGAGTPGLASGNGRAQPINLNPTGTAPATAESDLIKWFWEFFEQAEPKNQRKLLGFITGSDRIPALGATSLVIKISFAGPDHRRFPIARTCFNQLLLFGYRRKEELEEKLWRAVVESEGFGLK